MWKLLNVANEGLGFCEQREVTSYKLSTQCGNYGSIKILDQGNYEPKRNRIYLQKIQ